MSRKVLLVLAVLILLLSAAFWLISAQEEEHPIITTATDSVGVGTYVAAQALAIEGEEGEAPQALILPYGLYPDSHVLDIAEFEQPEPLVEGFTFEWALDGAELLASGQVAIFLADAEGQYTLSLTATDETGNAGETSWVVTATTYVGSGAYAEEPGHNQCAYCHADTASEWIGTGHANMLIEGLDGIASDHYSEDCISCHTTGFGMGDNGGFDDLAAEYGWTFPETLEPGNWEAMLAEFPEVAGMGNIQCESCHGPGLAHATAGTFSNPMIGANLDAGVCAQCHGEETHHVFPMQWENSVHGDLGAAGWTSETGRESCAQCHTGVGFIDFVNGEEPLRSDYQPPTCAVCHDPHSGENPMQLRVYDSVVLPEGEVSGVGPAATCMSCHNARRAGGAAGQVASGVETGRMSNPHHGNNQSALLTTGGGYTWGETLPSSPHGQVVEGVCVGCHMGADPGFDADGNPLPGRHEVGGHSFAMESEAAGENVVVCQDCHTDATTFAFEAARDYDGDGVWETNQEEIAGLREILLAALTDGGIENAEQERGFTLPENPSEELVGAFWNYHFTANPGTAVHNLRYSVALLQLSIEKLTGESVGQPLPER